MFKRYWWVWLLSIILMAYFWISIYPHYSLIDTTQKMDNVDEKIATVQAAWFQAIGSVAAILVAVLISNRERAASRSLVEAEQKRQRRIAESVLVTCLSGICLDCQSKGRLLVADAMNGNYKSFNPEKASQNLRLSSLEVIELQFPLVHSFEEQRGHEIAGELTAMLAYNRTLRDLCHVHGNSPSDLEKEFLVREIASRMRAHQERSLTVMRLLWTRIEDDVDFFSRLADASWYAPLEANH